MCLLALTSLGRAVTLELTFDQQNFETSTTGAFRLYGGFGIWSPGSSSSGEGTTSLIFEGSFRGTSTATPTSDFYFFLESYSASGTLQYNGDTYSILPEGRAMWLSFSPQYGNARPLFQVYVSPTPTGAGSSGGPIVDMTGTFIASKSGGAGMTFANMAGDYFPHEYDPSGPALTITVPEPSTASLVLLSGLPLLLRRRKTF